MSRISLFQVADATTAFGEPIAAEQLVLNEATNEIAKVTAAAAGTDTLTTATTVNIIPDNIAVTDADNNFSVGQTISGNLTVDRINTTDYINFTTATGTGGATERWIGADGANSTFYNVPTGENHLFGINNINALSISATSSDFTNTITNSSGVSSTVANLQYTGGTDAFIGVGGTGNDVFVGNKNGVFTVQTSGSSFSDKFSILENGNAGFGTNSPDTLLSIQGDDASTTVGDGTVALRLVNENVAGVNRLTGILMGGRDQSNKPFAAIQSYLVQDVSSEQQGGLIFSTKGTADATDPLERMRIDGDGRVGMGVSPLTNMAAGDLVLEGGSLVLNEITTPTADANYGKVYTKTDNELYFQDGAGTEHQISNQSGGGGLTWGDSITDSSGTGVTINPTGSARGMLINHDAGGAGNSHGLEIDSDPNGTGSGMNALRIDASNNAGSGTAGSAIRIFNRMTDVSLPNGQGIGVDIFQLGVGGTAIYVQGTSNVNSSTNGLVVYELDNTQSAASVLQKIDMGTSAQAHIGTEYDGSTSARVWNIGTNLVTGTAPTGTTTNYINMQINGVDYRIQADSVA